MEKRNVYALPRLDNPMGVDARFVFGGPTATLLTVILPPGGQVPAHPADVVVDFVVLSGRGVAEEAGVTLALEPGDVARFQPGIAHGLTASDEGLVLLAVKHGTF